jgi:glycosyltransferase involved in cell wall biosynthesis
MKQEFKKGITVLIPAHGKCEYLIETLQSLANSELSPNEILVINDGIESNLLAQVSTDFPSVKFIANDGKGLVDGLNTGLSHASFDLIARLDADDCALPERLGIQEKFMRENVDVSLIGSQVKYIGPSSREVGRSNYLLGDITKETQKGERCLLAHPSVMYRTAHALEVGGYRKVFTVKNVNLAEDYDLWVRLSRIGKVINLKESLTLYRQHPGQLSIMHRGPQEMASYYIRAISILESIPGKHAELLTINSASDAERSVAIVREILGLRMSLKYRIEVLSCFGKLNPLLRRVLIKFL